MCEHPPAPEKESSSEFIRSVMELTPENIGQTEKKKKSLFRFLSDHMRVLVLIICGAVLIWSVQYIITSLIQYAKADDLYGNIENIIMGNTGENGADMMLSSPVAQNTPDYSASQNLSQDDLDDIIHAPAVNKEFERLKIKLYSLKQQYPDLYGWIELPGTSINYPIMQSDDNEYYLTHSYRGTFLQAGSIFADYHCSRTLMSNYNLVLYGHHMADTSMFHSLDSYLDEDFFRNNNTVYIYTLDGMYTYKVFSVYATDKYYPYIQTVFTSSQSFLNFAERVRSNSIYTAEGITFDASDRLLTLSTCSNRTEDGRLAVHAILESYFIG